MPDPDPVTRPQAPPRFVKQTTPRRLEPSSERYARHQRNAIVLIAVIACLVFCLGTIGGIAAIVHAGHGSGAPACLSLGGTDPSC